MKRLERKTAVITGGSDGIGFDIASAFAENGASLVLVARNQEKLFHAKQLLQTKGVSVETVFADLKDLASIPQVTAALLERTNGQIHVLVNNVGVAYFKPLPDLSVPRDAQRVSPIERFDRERHPPREPAWRSELMR